MEKSVESSWISNIAYNRPNKIITMRLGNGRAYSIPKVARSVFDRWTSASSKGQFYHDVINGKYTVTKLS